MVQHLGLQMGGKLHCGLDDARNIAQIVIRIIQDGFWLDTNDKLPAKMRHCEASGAEQPPMQTG
jgi:3'-5' exoribonuclease 1